MQVPRFKYSPQAARSFPLAQGIGTKHLSGRVLPGTRQIGEGLREVPAKAAMTVESLAFPRRQRQ